MIDARFLWGAILLAACGGEPAPAVSAPTASVVVAPAQPVAASPPPVADAGAPIAAPPVAPEADARTPQGAAEFLAALCRHAKSAGTEGPAWIEEHVSRSLRGNVVIVKERPGDPGQLGSLGESRAVAHWLVQDNGVSGTACDVLSLPASSISGFASTGADSHGLVRGAGDGYRFSIRSGGAHTTLAEVSVDLPAHPVPARAKRHAFQLNGNVVHAADGDRDGEALGSFLQWVIRRTPGCVYESAAREETSAVLIVHAVKADLAPATARLYASTVVPASLVACLEGQLSRAVAETFKGTPFEVDYLLRVLIPSSKPLDPSVPTIVGGP